MEEESLKDTVKKLKELMEKKELENKPKEKKVREFKIPFSGRVKGRKLKNNWITVLEVNENRNGQFKKYPIQDQTVMIDKVPRLATADNVIMIGKNPLLILPKYSVKPISPSDKDYEFFDISKEYKDNEMKGLNIKGYKVLFDRMKNEAISAKKSMPIWIWFVILGVIGIAIYFLMKK